MALFADAVGGCRRLARGLLRHEHDWP